VVEVVAAGTLTPVRLLNSFTSFLLSGPPDLVVYGGAEPAVSLLA
jgi:hypothetical protein